MNFAEVLFQQKTGSDKETLTYQVPENLKIKTGDLVKVPFRRQEKHGIVWKIHNEKPSFKTLPIKEIIHETPLLSEKQIKLMTWFSKYYFCELSKILKLFIPKRIFNNNPINSRTKKLNKIKATPPKTPNQEQKNIIKEITNSKEKSFLINGITGSGKTEVYTQIAKKHLKKGEQCLLLVPEISLTPQLIDYVESALEEKVEVIHSKRSAGEIQDSWFKIWNNEAKLVIGSRSAIFAPFRNLGLIIIDEEHEFSYKQDSSPRYSTHSIIEKMQKIDPNLKTIFGSATPSVESSEKLEKTTLYLKNRIGEAKLPEVELVDLREEFKKGNHSIFSESLAHEIKNTLDNKKQAILFLNRRGEASAMVCRDCGFKVNCENCELPMTYHSKTLKKGYLICHHCGKIETPPETCPNCKGVNIRFLGIGTQKIEIELQKHFPEARVLRADKDTTATKEGFQKIYQKFKNHEADILVGTQMIAKGLDLPQVNLVGVILADIGLNIPDFRTNERNFQLMTQVAGRAGRDKTPGKVIIQTYSPENTTLKFSQTHDFENFLNYERTQRKLLSYPPFSKLGKILIEDNVSQKCKEKAEKLENLIWKIARENNFTKDLEINVYPAYIMRLRNKYRYILLIKDKTNSTLINEILEKTKKEDIMDANIKIDLDPIAIT
jgi:primosomal protein N' (replication factor Y) (superfamily II helicase)